MDRLATGCDPTGALLESRDLVAGRSPGGGNGRAPRRFLEGRATASGQCERARKTARGAARSIGSTRDRRPRPAVGLRRGALLSGCCPGNLGMASCNRAVYAASHRAWPHLPGLDSLRRCSRPRSGWPDAVAGQPPGPRDRSRGRQRRESGSARRRARRRVFPAQRILVDREADRPSALLDCVSLRDTRLCGGKTP